MIPDHLRWHSHGIWKKKVFGVFWKCDDQKRVFASYHHGEKIVEPYAIYVWLNWDMEFDEERLELWRSQNLSQTFAKNHDFWYRFQWPKYFWWMFWRWMNDDSSPTWMLEHWAIFGKMPFLFGACWATFFNNIMSNMEIIFPKFREWKFKLPPRLALWGYLEGARDNFHLGFQ